MLAMVPEIDLDSYNPGSKEANEMFTRVVGWVKELIIVVRRELLERESIRMDVEVSYIGIVYIVTLTLTLTLTPNWRSYIGLVSMSTRYLHKKRCRFQKRNHWWVKVSNAEED